MRSCYSEDYGDDFPGQINLFRANVERSLKSAKGQARLRELRDALLAMPVKALQYETFAAGTREQPEVCALGAWALAKSDGDPDAARRIIPRSNPDDDDATQALHVYGWPRLVVLEAIYQNDEAVWTDETPERRYERMLAWVNNNLVAVSHD